MKKDISLFIIAILVGFIVLFVFGFSFFENESSNREILVLQETQKVYEQILKNYNIPIKLIETDTKKNYIILGENNLENRLLYDEFRNNLLWYDIFFDDIREWDVNTKH